MTDANPYLIFGRWMSPAALDLAERLLAYDPSQRVTAIQAMDAPYFTQEEPRAAPPVGLVHNSLFEVFDSRKTT